MVSSQFLLIFLLLSASPTLLSLSPNAAGTTTMEALGAPTTPPTSRTHYNLVIRKFSLIHKKTK